MKYILECLEEYWNVYTTAIIFILICNLFLWCKAESSASLLQPSVLRDPSEIILICWFYFVLSCSSSYVENCLIFCWNHDTVFQDSLMFKQLKYNIWNINAFTVTFDQFNDSSLNQSIHFFLNNKSYWPWSCIQICCACYLLKLFTVVLHCSSIFFPKSLLKSETYLSTSCFNV